LLQTWKVTLEYDGTRYSGWQDQKNARTVMGEVRAAFQSVLGVDIEIQGAGRTDAGVHASAQVAHVRAVIKRHYSSADLLRRVNDELPQDIAVLEIADAPARFHARHDAVTRSYVYQISTRKTAFSKKYVWWIKEPLDVDRMAEAARKIAGRHDFVCFRAKDPSKPDESTIVVVDSAAVERQDDLILFRIEASHFLWRMVRRLVGVLVRLGKGEATMHDFDRLLSGQCDPKLDVAAWTAPSSGLFLESVHYPATPSATKSRVKPR
jgi:tRNA pseudouridine38-40 synthase